MTFRPVRARIAAAVVAVVALVATWGLAVLLPSGSNGFGWPYRVALVIIGLAMVALLALLARPRISADEDGLTVVNLVSSRRLAWAEVVAVDLRVGDSWVSLDLSDGEALPAMGIQVADGQRGLLAAAQLRALVDERTRTERDT